MKKLFVIILFFCSFNSFSQENIKIDSVFYLLDTAKMPVNDRMWDIFIEKSSMNKYYTIRCPCLINEGNPTFVYGIESKDNGLLINKKELKTIKLISISALILKLKQIENKENRGDCAIFLIEPKREIYIMHKVDFINLNVHFVLKDEVIEKKPDNSEFEKNGLEKVGSKDITKYINRSVITTGKIFSSKVIESGNMVLLMVNADYPNQDFAIIIKGKNLNNFDQPEFVYNGKQIRVTGKVIEYKGKPAIEISNFNQIQRIGAK